MKLVDIREDIIDDIFSDFPTYKSSGRPSTPLKEPPKSSSREPIKIKGINHESFAQWLRSEEQVRKALQDNLGTPKMTLKNCIALYTEYNIKIDDYVTLNFPTKDVYPYREYDREMKDGWTGKMDQEEYTGLMKDIKKNGIRNPGVLDIVNLKNGAYEVQLGEGNHRLRMAIALGIEAFPLHFYYMFG